MIVNYLRPAEWLRALPARLAVWAMDSLWPSIRSIGTAVASWPPLARLHGRVGRLPAPVALPLFLVPELCSRFGWVVSAWLVLRGEPWEALAVYLGTKLVAGSLALWVCSACMPVLLRQRHFALAHAALMRVQRATVAWVSRRRGPRFAAAVARVRADRVRARSSAADPVSATAFVPADPSRRG